MTSLRRLCGLLAPHQKRVYLALALTALACLLSLPIPILTQAIVDRALAAEGVRSLPLLLGGILAAFAAQAGAGLASALLIGRVGLELVRDLRHQLYARLQRLGLHFFDATPAGAILSRIMDDTAAVQALVTSQTLAILTDLGTTAAVLVWLGCCHPVLLAVVLSFVPLYVVVFRWFTRRIRTGTTQVRRRLDDIFAHLKEKLDGMVVVKACAQEAREITDFAAQIDAAHEPRLRVGCLGAAFSTLTAALGGAGAALVFAVSAVEILAGRMTPGQAIAATAFVALIFGPIARLADLTSLFQHASASLERLGEILDQQPDLVEPRHPIALDRVRGRVEFDQVSFGYHPGQNVLTNIRLAIEPGMKIALVGPTGCGKSTLANLLLRFYEPRSGEIRIDGTPIRQLAVAELRRRIGIVPQEAVLFRQSLAANIRYGAPGASEAEVEAAASAALVHDFAVSLPLGYATVIGEGGHRLSHGERQRVAIARAFCKDPAIVVLDEPTSALDSESEALIQAALAGLLRGRTALILAHRLATVMSADGIIVMNQGQIVQFGTHAQLFADSDGLYQRLCLRQWSGGDENLSPFVCKIRTHRRHEDFAESALVAGGAS